MFEIFGIPSQALFGQLLLGLINGSFYALLSLGLAVIFGMLNIINFTPRRPVHDGRLRGLSCCCNMPGSATGRRWSSRRSWSASPASSSSALFLQWLYKLDHLYGLLLTFGLALIIEGVFRNYFGSSGLPYRDAGRAAGRPESRLHVPAELSRLGDRRSRSPSASAPGS